MPFTLDQVIPWGRSMDEYEAMFALSEQDLDSRILSCADGPAGFNAEMHARGKSVISIDPVYQFTAEEIQRRIDAVYPSVMEQLQQNLDDFVWTDIASPAALGKLRLKTMARFLADFPAGKTAGRYQSYSLPTLPFADQTFDLALCSHFLFLYSGQFSADFHCQSIQEMLRVAGEVRIFPLITLEGAPSPHLEKVYKWLAASGLRYEVKTVDYEFQRGGNRMLRIWLDKPAWLDQVNGTK